MSGCWREIILMGNRFLLLLAATAAAAPVSAGKELVRDRIYIVPFGKTELGIVEALRAPLEKRLALKVVVDKPRPVPEEACNRDRAQHLSTTFLSALSRACPKDAVKVLGVADVDLYVPRLNFVFGEAQIAGRVAVISLARLRPEYYGEPEDKQVFTSRMIKEAVHELGHTFDLRHCANSGCVMFFSNSLMDTDRKGADFCAACARKLSNIAAMSEK